jgi:hypothetical protein
MIELTNVACSFSQRTLFLEMLSLSIRKHRFVDETNFVIREVSMMYYIYSLQNLLFL